MRITAKHTDVYTNDLIQPDEAAQDNGEVSTANSEQATFAFGFMRLLHGDKCSRVKLSSWIAKAERAASRKWAWTQVAVLLEEGFGDFPTSGMQVE